MYYPVTDAAMDTAPTTSSPPATTSAARAMEWFWDAYAPDPAQRSEITASPNQATVEQAPRAAADVPVRRRGRRPARRGRGVRRKLRAAGVPVTTVRYDGTVHDFMLLNSLSDTHATRAAIAQATAFLRAALGTD